jgi:hypothetical protein
LFYKVMNQAPPRLADLRPDIFPGMVHIIDKAMAKRPEARFASLNEMVSAMEVAVQALGLMAPDAGMMVPNAPVPGEPAVHPGTVVMYARPSNGNGEPQGSSAVWRQTEVVRPKPGLLARVATLPRAWKLAAASALCVPLGLSLWWVARPSTPKPLMRADQAEVTRRLPPIVVPLAPHEPVLKSSSAVSAPKPSDMPVFEPPVITNQPKQPARMHVAKDISGPPSTRALPRSEAGSSVKRSNPATTPRHRAGDLTVDDF